MQNLILLPKGNKPTDDPSGYRPICLLETEWKFLEMTIATRISNFIEERGAFSVKQYGFLTIDAIKAVTDMAEAAIAGSRWKGGDKENCAMVKLDIRNVLRALFLAGISAYLQRIESSYLSDRTLIYETDEGTKKYDGQRRLPDRGCSTRIGSRTAPLDHLRIELPEGWKLIGVADDLALVVVAKEPRKWRPRRTRR